MASSGTISMVTDDSYWKGRFKWSASTNESTLKTTVSYRIQIYRNVDTNAVNYAQYDGWTSIWNNTSDKEIAYHEISKKNVGVSPKTWTTIHSGSFTVTHSSSTGRAPSIGLDGAYEGTNDLYFYIPRGSTITLNTIKRFPTLLSATNFTDEENPTITYSVPAPGSTTLLQACISFDGSLDNILYRNIDKNATSYTFNLTDAERETLRKGTLNGSTTRTVYFYIKYTVGGTTSTIKLGKTLTIVNAAPDLSAFLMDTNQKTVALTGDALARIIKGYSNVSYEMSASGKKGASIVSYKIENGSTVKTTSSGVFNGVTNATFKLSVTDNRNLTTTRTFTLNMIDYARPSCTQEAKIELVGETAAKITIKVNGKWSSKHFGAVHNALRVEYRYKEEGGSWSAWEGTDYVTDNSNYAVTFTKDGLLYSNAYTIQSRAVDSLNEVVTGEYTLKLTPVFDWSDEDFNVNVPFKMNGKTVLRHNATANNVVLSSSGGFIYFRPGGTDPGTPEILMSPQGNIQMNGDILFNGKSLLTALRNAGISI